MGTRNGPLFFVEYRCARVVQLVECLLPKQKVAGSNPVSRFIPLTYSVYGYISLFFVLTYILGSGPKPIPAKQQNSSNFYPITLKFYIGSGPPKYLTVR
jgi:hypothetical protein